MTQITMPSEVLTPAQMRAKLAGLPIPPTEVQEGKMKEVLLQDKLDSINKKIAKVHAATKTKKMTPQQIREGLDLLFQKYDFNPVEDLIQTAQGTADESLSTRICMFLTEFLVPKLKSIEVSGTVEHNHTVVIRRFGPSGEIQDTPAPRMRTLEVQAERVIDEEVRGE